MYVLELVGISASSGFIIVRSFNMRYWLLTMVLQMNIYHKENQQNQSD